MKGCEQQYSYTNIWHITKWNNNKRSKFVSSERFTTTYEATNIISSNTRLYEIDDKTT